MDKKTGKAFLKEQGVHFNLAETVYNFLEAERIFYKTPETPTDKHKLLCVKVVEELRAKNFASDVDPEVLRKFIKTEYNRAVIAASDIAAKLAPFKFTEKEVITITNTLHGCLLDSQVTHAEHEAIIGQMFKRIDHLVVKSRHGNTSLQKMLIDDYNGQHHRNKHTSFTLIGEGRASSGGAIRPGL